MISRRLLDGILVDVLLTLNFVQLYGLTTDKFLKYYKDVNDFNVVNPKGTILYFLFLTYYHLLPLFLPPIYITIHYITTHYHWFPHPLPLVSHPLFVYLSIFKRPLIRLIIKF